MECNIRNNLVTICIADQWTTDYHIIRNRTLGCKNIILETMRNKNMNENMSPLKKSGSRQTKEPVEKPIKQGKMCF